jgi:hypothetical protein
MQEREYESIEQMQGSMAQKNVKEPAAFERANYMKVLGSWRDAVPYRKIYLAIPAKTKKTPVAKTGVFFLENWK